MLVNRAKRSKSPKAEEAGEGEPLGMHDLR